MADRIALRQVCAVVEQLEPVLDCLVALGLRVCHGKGDLSRYGVPYHEPPPYQKAFFAQHGITGALLPIGDAFLELIAPLRPDTPAARYLQKRGPGGYMVITEVESTAPFLARAAAAGARVAGTADYPTYHEVQLDPRTVGGSILSFSMQREGRPFDGGWFPAGAGWQERAAPGWTGITAAVLAVKDPAQVARRWSALMARPVEEDEAGPRIRLDNATIEFRAGEGEDRLRAIAVAAPAFRAALAKAQPHERSVDGKALRIAGLEIRETPPCS
jgi:hypothetical protein